MMWAHVCTHAHTHTHIPFFDIHYNITKFSLYIFFLISIDADTSIQHNHSMTFERRIERRHGEGKGEGERIFKKAFEKYRNEHLGWLVGRLVGVDNNRWK